MEFLQMECTGPIWDLENYERTVWISTGTTLLPPAADPSRWKYTKLFTKDFEGWPHLSALALFLRIRWTAGCSLFFPLRTAFLPTASRFGWPNFVLFTECAGSFGTSIMSSQGSDAISVENFSSSGPNDIEYELSLSVIIGCVVVIAGGCCKSGTNSRDACLVFSSVFLLSSSCFFGKLMFWTGHAVGRSFLPGLILSWTVSPILIFVRNRWLTSGESSSPSASALVAVSNVVGSFATSRIQWSRSNSGSCRSQAST